MKKIIFTLVCILTIILIYFMKKDGKIMIFEISDVNISSKKVINLLNRKQKLNDYIKYINNKNYTLIELLNDINNNKKITNKYYINNLFVKSNYIFLNIGNNDIKYYISNGKSMYDNLDNFIIDYENILRKIKEVSKEQIIIIFDYDLQEKYNDYLYNRLSKFKKEYSVLLFSREDLYNYLKYLY